MRIMNVIGLALLVWFVLCSSALAISSKNEVRLAEYFAAKGTVHYSLYAPLGGPQVGGAVFDDGDGSGRLIIAIVAKAGITELINENLPQISSDPPFTFLLTGHHALVYPTREWVDTQGISHQCGDLAIYDLTYSVTATKLYELKNVCDLRFQAGGAFSNDNLLRQPAQHYLNHDGVLPVKYNYFQLTFEPKPEDEKKPAATPEVIAPTPAADTAPKPVETLVADDDDDIDPIISERASTPTPKLAPAIEQLVADSAADDGGLAAYTYVLTLPLTALPDAASIDAANLNNRAIYSYYRGNLLEASRLLEQADGLADADQGTILHNQAMINSELDDLGAQGRLLPDRTYDEALQYYLQGDYLGVLRIMDARRQLGFTDLDYALLALSLAHENRWPEVDRITIALEHLSWQYLDDFLWELYKIADNQGYKELDGIANRRLLALETVNPRHPGYVVGLARLLRSTGEEPQAQQLLEDFVFNPANTDADISEPRWELFDTYHRQGNQIGCDKLLRDALTGPIANLLGYVQIADYIDYSTAMIDIPLDRSGRMKAPEFPLETFGQVE